MGMAIDQARRGQLALAVMLGQVLVIGRHGVLRTHPDHAALLHDDGRRSALGHIPLVQTRRQAQIEPAAIGAGGLLRGGLHGKTPCDRGIVNKGAEL